MLRAPVMCQTLQTPVVRTAVAAFVLLLATLPAQTCERPTVPGGVHGMRIGPTNTITYSDGYVTQANLLVPDTLQPNCRWPLVVFVHQLGGSRISELALQQQVVSEGHAVWTYDVRGQGSGIFLNSNHPNRGATLWGPAEFADLAEQIQHVVSQHAATIDPSRIAIMGISQGSAHAWRAAAWSGQPLAVPGRGVSSFPQVRCVVAVDYVAESTEDWIRNGSQFSSWFVNVIADDAVPSWNLDPDFRGEAAHHFRTQNPQGLLNLWQQQGRPVLPQLLQSAVPILYSHAYHDFIDSPLPALEVVERMPQNGAIRCLLSTVGHDTQSNEHEVRLRNREIVAWLHRHLWDELPSDVRSRFSLALMPVEIAVREDPTSLWGRIERESIQPPQQLQPVRMNLHPDGTMQPSPSATTFNSIRHEVLDPGYDAANYLTNIAQRDTNAVLSNIPLCELAFEAAPLSRPRTIHAAPSLDLVVTPSHPNWALAALLTVEIPGEPEFMLASAGAAGNGDAPNVARTVSMRFPPVATQLPTGTIVRLRVRNHWLREYPMSRTLEVAPLFHSHRVTVHYGTSGGSWLDLPMEDVAPQLLTASLNIDLRRPQTVRFGVRSDLELAGAPCFVTLGAYGQVEPMLNVDGYLLPQQAEFLQATQAWQLENGGGSLFGTLDAIGTMKVVFDLVPFTPLPVELAGMELEFRPHAIAPVGAMVRTGPPVLLRFR